MTGLGYSPPRSKKESSDVDETDDESLAGKVQPDPQPGERQDAKHLREQAKLLARARRDEAHERIRASKAARRSEERAAQRAARESKAADRAARRDRIVEAPRAPKKSMIQRLRPDTPKTTKAPKASARGRVRAVLAVLLGVLGLICSIILAVGALLAAKGVDETGSFYETVAGICDALIGPLRGVISFEGANAEMKESLVAWGAGSIVYLLAGLVGQSLLRSAAED